ncbi:hypothetical protein [Nocardia rhizosphaerae]|uniref:Uncharacterized protein n=1 Tax=Nocardia rhizosphaerae TaxID=1691571 RepID=A0ABV8LF21_9NOCA
MADETPKFANGGPITGEPLGRLERIGIGADGRCIHDWVRDEGDDEQRE